MPKIQHDYPLSQPTKHATHLRLEVLYDKGGMNYATYRQNPRGYYLSVGVIAKGVSERGVAFESFAMFSASGGILETTMRFSQKRLEELFTMAKRDADDRAGTAWDLIKAKLEEASLTLA